MYHLSPTTTIFPFCLFDPLSLSFPFIPLLVSRFLLLLLLLPPGVQTPPSLVHRPARRCLPSGSSARRTLYLHHQIHLGLPRGARTQTAASGLAGGLRQIGHRVTRMHSGCLAGWLVGQHPPFCHHWLNIAAWRRRACHRTLRFLSANVPPPFRLLAPTREEYNFS